MVAAASAGSPTATAEVASMMRYGRATGGLTILGKRVADYVWCLIYTTVPELALCLGCFKAGSR